MNPRALVDNYRHPRTLTVKHYIEWVNAVLPAECLDFRRGTSVVEEKSILDVRNCSMYPFVSEKRFTRFFVDFPLKVIPESL